MKKRFEENESEFKVEKEPILNDEASGEDNYDN